MEKSETQHHNETFSLQNSILLFFCFDCRKEEKKAKGIKIRMKILLERTSPGYNESRREKDREGEREGKSLKIVDKKE